MSDGPGASIELRGIGKAWSAAPAVGRHVDSRGCRDVLRALPGRARCQHGDRVSLGFDHADLHLFDTDGHRMTMPTPEDFPMRLTRRGALGCAFATHTPAEDLSRLTPPH